MKLIGYVCICLLGILLVNSCATKQDQRAGNAKENVDQEQVVVFVCEHGSAKSIIAAAHFNRLAAEKGLKLRAVARGTNPDEELSSKTVEGLGSDGLKASEQKPKQLSKDDIVGVSRVVAFCQLPEDYYKAVSVQEWKDVPSVGEDYNKARDVMVERIKHLLDEIKMEKK